ncbi:MAG: efflux RND transporter permease subunit [Pseudomonadota bacterium]
MTGLVDWFATRARMTLVFIAVCITAGIAAYQSLPKEGPPDIDIPVLYVSVPLPGVSAADSELLLIKPLENELRELDGLKEMTGIAAQDHAGVLLEFDFDWDKQAVLADVRSKVDQAQAEFPEDAEEPTINEVNLSQFPVLVVSLSGAVPERTLQTLGDALKKEIEALPNVLEASLTGHRDEMFEVLIDPLRLESYGLTASDLLRVIDGNNLLVAAGEIESGSASFAVSVPGAIKRAEDVNDLPLRVDGDRVIRLRDVAEIRRTFEDPESRARFNGVATISLQVSKRIGENIIDTVRDVRTRVAEQIARWPEPLRQAVRVDFSMDESDRVVRMVRQLESSVTTAVLLVMLVVLAALGTRAAALVGMAIPCSFLLSFALMSVVGMGINNMVMFGLILAVGMLVDGAIVVVEFADKRIAAGEGPMRAYTQAAKRMFWPITASTATTLCAFLPLILWPGMPGEFMGQLPTTLIFVLTASLIVALVFLPVLGGVAGRLSRFTDRGIETAKALSTTTKVIVAAAVIGAGLGVAGLAAVRGSGALPLLAVTGVAIAAMLFATLVPKAKARPMGPRPYRRTLFGKAMSVIVMNPVGPLVAIGIAVASIAGIFTVYGANNAGVEFFVETDAERAVIHVRARGNLSLDQRDRLVRMVEERVIGTPGVSAVFALSGAGNRLAGALGGDGPPDAVGQVQIELAPWEDRGAGQPIIEDIEARIADVPGVITEITILKDGPVQGKPVQLELSADSFEALHQATAIARDRFERTEGLINIDDTRPLPGIEWEIDVDRAVAGRFGADIATIGPMVQFVTRGAILATSRPEDSAEELEIRVRFPEEARTLSTLDNLRVETDLGTVPISAFVERRAVPKLGEIQRRDTRRFFMVRADVASDASDIAIIGDLERWIAEETPFGDTVRARFVGDREEQADSMAFLRIAFAGALGLMFIILLAQFNSLFNAVLVLSAVVMSVAGVLVGMMVMGQKFSIIMTGTGILALAGIVVNNNIVLIDTYQDFVKRMPPLEAILRTAEDRIRPVLLTTVTTMAGLMPMVFATSLDFANGAVNQGAPTALWWVSLATAVVFGLGLATVLTLVVTPAALAARVWAGQGLGVGVPFLWHWLRGLVSKRHRAHPMLADRRLKAQIMRAQVPEVVWHVPPSPPKPVVRAAE